MSKIWPTNHLWIGSEHQAKPLTMASLREASEKALARCQGEEVKMESIQWRHTEKEQPSTHSKLTNRINTLCKRFGDPRRVSVGDRHDYVEKLILDILDILDHKAQR